MSKTTNQQVGSFTASSGAASASLEYEQSTIYIVSLSPTTGSTQYDVALTTDINGTTYTLYQSATETGDSVQEVEIPVRGTVTLSIANATVDEAFTYYVSAKE